MEDSGRRTNHVVEKTLYQTLDNIANDPNVNLWVALEDCSKIENLAIRISKSVFNEFAKKPQGQPYVGYSLFEEYLMSVAKKGRLIGADPTTGFVQVEIKKSTLRGQEFPPTDGLWFHVNDGQVTLYRNKEEITYGDL